MYNYQGIFFRGNLKAEGNLKHETPPYRVFCLFVIAFLLFSFSKIPAQTLDCPPLIKIDGNFVPANSTLANGLALPLWLNAGQTIAPATMVNSISVIEFAVVNGNTLQFSQVLSITAIGTVPANTVWKVESVIKQTPQSLTSSITYTIPGTNSFTVPNGVTTIFIQIWGGGGGGGGLSTGANQGGGGGGGGGYGSQCFGVSPSASLSVTVGTGGVSAASSSGTSGGASSVTGSNVSIAATGGNGGGLGIGTGGAGGASTATNNVSGQSGLGGTLSLGGAGGGGGNGGTGGPQQPGTGNGFNGASPGGGGGGANNLSNTNTKIGGAGGAGQVIISW